MQFLAPLIWLVVSCLVAFFAYWGAIRVRDLLLQKWGQGHVSKLFVVGCISVFCFFSLTFFTLLDVKTDSLLIYTILIGLVLAGFELHSSEKDNVLTAQEQRLRNEQRRAQLSTGEGWGRGDVLEKFCTTIYYRKYGRLETTLGWRCAVCGKNLYQRADASIDHIRPLSKYPELKFSETNLQILCRPCNSTKSAYDGEDWILITRKRRRVIRKKLKVINDTPKTETDKNR